MTNEDKNNEELLILDDNVTVTEPEELIMEDTLLSADDDTSLITFDDEIHIIYYVHKFKNIPNDYNDIYQEKLHPRWAWPKHRMSDYYKIYNIPQLII